jgi:hypothetical protein
MTEQDITRIVQRFYEHIGRRDIQSAVNLMTPDVEWWVPQMDGVPFSGVWHGRDGVEAFFRKVAESQEQVEFHIDELVAQRDKVVVLGRFVMLVRATGRTSASRWVHVWTLRNGEIAQMREFVDTATVMAAHRADRGPLLSP